MVNKSDDMFSGFDSSRLLSTEIRETL